MGLTHITNRARAHTQKQKLHSQNEKERKSTGKRLKAMKMADSSFVRLHHKHDQCILWDFKCVNLLQQATSFRSFCSS